MALQRDRRRNGLPVDREQTPMGAELFVNLGKAFLGGLILNVMPCVLPVLTMKVFHIVEHADDDASTHRGHGVAYTGGILASFLTLAAIVIGLRATGETLGWGMQFQNPAFVAALTALMVTFGLNALGVFEFTVSMSSSGAGKGGYGESFVNGIVATVMSTPCSAPMLGAAVGFALASDATWWQTGGIFAFMGLGLASPFLLISFMPALSAALPRPGPWMETFKQLMGFSLLAAAVWLYSVLQAQIDRSGAAFFLGFLLVLAIALWAVGRFGGIMASASTRWWSRGVAAALVLGGGFLFIDLSPPPAPPPAVCEQPEVAVKTRPVVAEGRINWMPFSSEIVAREGKRNRPVFMDFTADWCATCKANEKAFIETKRIRSVLTDTSILPMKADMTNENEEIEAWLNKLGRSGIPAYVIYMPDGSYDLLPEVITTKLLADRLLAASAKYPPTGFAAPTTTADAGS
jgi:thiol:disulfide interchange protein DsbD